MYRVASVALVVVALSGCAHDVAVPTPVKPRVVTKIVHVDRPVPGEKVYVDREVPGPERIVIKTKTCPTIRRPDVAAICGNPVACKAIKSCAEAIYRLKTCGHEKLDVSKGEPNGIPCERLHCGSNDAEMKARIAAKPFLVPMLPDEALPCGEPK